MKLFFNGCFGCSPGCDEVLTFDPFPSNLNRISRAADCCTSIDNQYRCIAQLTPLLYGTMIFKTPVDSQLEKECAAGISRRCLRKLARPLQNCTFVGHLRLYVSCRDANVKLVCFPKSTRLPDSECGSHFVLAHTHTHTLLFALHDMTIWLSCAKHKLSYEQFL